MKVLFLARKEFQRYTANQSGEKTAMGWIITVLGIALIGIGTFFTFYGQNLVNAPQIAKHSQQSIVLSPKAEKLLSLIQKYQNQFALNKLIISRETGELFFDEETMRKENKINLIVDLYGINSKFESKSEDFENTMLSIPPVYLRVLPEMRFDSPYVVMITQEGIQYLRD